MSDVRIDLARETTSTRVLGRCLSRCRRQHPTLEVYWRALTPWSAIIYGVPRFVLPIRGAA